MLRIAGMDGGGGQESVVVALALTGAVAPPPLTVAVLVSTGLSAVQVARTPVMVIGGKALPGARASLRVQVTLAPLTPQVQPLPLAATLPNAPGTTSVTVTVPAVGPEGKPPSVGTV